MNTEQIKKHFKELEERHIQEKKDNLKINIFYWSLIIGGILLIVLTR